MAGITSKRDGIHPNHQIRHSHIERYWLDKFSGERNKSYFPYDFKKNGGKHILEEKKFRFTGELYSQLIKLSNQSDPRLHMILVTAVIALLNRYTGNSDITVAVPVYKQEKEGEFINTTLPLKNEVNPETSFKDLLLQVRQSILEAVENQNYPIELLTHHLKNQASGVDSSLFDMAILLENIHEKKNIQLLKLDMCFIFNRTGEGLEGVLEYNPGLYLGTSIQGIIHHLTHLFNEAVFHVNTRISDLELLSAEEKQQLLFDFNNTALEYPKHKTIDRLFQEQVERSPDHIAAVVNHENSEGVPLPMSMFITYRALNEKSNQLANRLRKRGVELETIVLLMMDRSLEMVVAILGILKAGGIYVPLDPKIPEARIESILKDSGASILLTKNNLMSDRLYNRLQYLFFPGVEPFLTNKRPSIENFDHLPIPNRSLVNYEKYNHYIGQAMVKHSVALQATRGCPYNCTYCHKIWPKKHVRRSAENIFEEVFIYYNMGVKRFVFVDDIFNLDMENSKRFFQMVIQKGLDIRFFFPNGMRGDILTTEYIDLMIEAGTVNVALALETASPRLQKLIQKNLDLNKLRENIEYFNQQYPNVIVELFTMHGFPTETKEEARMTLDFIKSLQWVHFPYIFILRIYPNTDMAKLAFENGVSLEAINASEDLTFHELADTLPFDRNFTLQYQAEFLKDYFLNKERLLHVLPYQMKLLTEDELVQKYDSYLNETITSLSDLLRLAGISEDELKDNSFVDESAVEVPDFNRKSNEYFSFQEPKEDALRVLLLDLSQFFSDHEFILYDVVDPPLGLMYLLTYLKSEFGNKVNGRLAKSRIDFDSHKDLRMLLKRFNPHVIGIRTLTFFKNFFHKTVALIRQWGIDVPIIAGGPYATSSYKTLLQDPNIDLVVLGEGELTFTQVIQTIIDNNRTMPDEETLKKISGIAFIPQNEKLGKKHKMDVIMLDSCCENLSKESTGNLIPKSQPENLAYAIFTSGSTGNPKGVMLEHRNVTNLVTGLNERIYKSYNNPQKVALVSPFVFDASVKQIFGALLLGNSLYLAPEETRIDGDGLIRFYKKHQIDVSDGTPGHLQLILESININHNDRETGLSPSFPVKHFIIGGEALPWKLTADFLEVFKPNRPTITNVYGPTECCVDASSFKITMENINLPGDIPIGKPMPNYQVYILNRKNKLQPIGVVGELCIAGFGVARGYLNRPELTANKFIQLQKGWQHRPIKETSQLTLNTNTLYKTSDLAMWLPDGNLKFLGRMDHQVKIKGFRIELGEIENHMLKYKRIKGAVAKVNESETGDKSLCLYYVSEEKLPVSLLKDHLSNQLPAYMIPSYFIWLNKIPLTPNGKPDRKRLPKPKADQIGLTYGYTAPRNEKEKLLAGIWSEVLDMENIGIHYNFFDLGGHSLKAVSITSRINKELNVELPISAIFERPTIVRLVEVISRNKPEDLLKIERSPKNDYYPLSHAQKRLWFFHQMEPDNPAYNVSLNLRIKGELVPYAFKKAIEMLVHRHESLRTSIEVPEGDAMPVQVIYDSQRIHVDVDWIDISNLPGEEKPQKLGQLIKESGVKPFELTHAPLFKTTVIQIGDREQVVIFVLHHIICDAWSHRILNREFVYFYNKAINQQKDDLPPFTVHYKEFAHWQNQLIAKNELKGQHDYWHNKLGGEIPLLDLPYDYHRSSSLSILGDKVTFRIDETLNRKLKQLGKKESCTLFMILIAAFKVLIYRYTQQEDIIIGTLTAGRTAHEFEKVVGYFVNIFALRDTVKGRFSFKELLKNVRRTMLDAYDNQDYPFDKLVDELNIKRDITRTPVFEIMMVFLNNEEPQVNSSLEPFEIEVMGRDYVVNKYDIYLEIIEMPTQLRVNFEFRTDLYKKQTVERMSKYYLNILDSVTHLPEQLISKIDMISESEKKRLLIDFNDTQRECPRDKRFHDLYQKQAAATPDKIACKHNAEAITYRQLNSKANRIAHYLINHGIQPGMMVALFMKRSIRMLASIIGVFKAGAIYVPIEVDYPDERIRFMLCDSEAQAVVVDPDTGQKLRQIFQDSSDTGIQEFVYLDPSDALKTCREDNPFYKSTADDLAYMIYTSGSTGKPKGVLIHQLGMLNHLYAKIHDLSINENDRIAQTASQCFDISVWQLLSALLEGGTTVIFDYKTVLNPEAMLKGLQEEKITIFQSVPSLISTFLGMLEGMENIELKYLRWMISTGEALKLELVHQWFKYYPGVKLVNAYGPTEASDDITHYIINSEADVGEQSVPIGKPVQNMQIYILNKDLSLCPIGVRGEICVAGLGVGQGYWKEPQKTKQAFISNPYTRGDYSREYATLYKTGDIGYYRDDGIIECLGRIDNQVKIRGFRIELEEIEAVMSQHPSLNECAVVIKKKQDGTDSIVGFLVEQELVDLEELKRFLHGYLPNYMVPSAFVKLDKFPLTVSGKTDRQALAAMDIDVLSSTPDAALEFVAPRSHAEKVIADIWADILEKDAISVNDNFFDIGGHSLLVPRIHRKLEKQFPGKCEIADLFEHMTISRLSHHIDGTIETGEEEEIIELSID